MVMFSMEKKSKQFRLQLLGLSLPLLGMLSFFISTPVVGQNMVYVALQNMDVDTVADTIHVNWVVYRLIDQIENLQPGFPVPSEEVQIDNQFSFQVELLQGTYMDSPLDSDTVSGVGSHTFHQTIDLDQIYWIRVSLRSLPPGYRNVTEEVQRIMGFSPELGVARLSFSQSVFPKPLRQKILGILETIKSVIVRGGRISVGLAIILIFGLIYAQIYCCHIFGRRQYNPLYLRKWPRFVLHSDFERICQLVRGKNEEDIARDPALRILRHVHDDTQEILADRRIYSPRQLQHLRVDVLTHLNEAVQRLKETELKWKKGSRRFRIFVPGLEAFIQIGLVAPMFGLLGTVLGISKTFDTVAIFSAKMGFEKEMLADFAGHIYYALDTTVAGLAVGLLFFLFYYGFRFCIHKIETYLFETGEAFITRFLDELVRNGRIYQEWH